MSRWGGPAGGCCTSDEVTRAMWKRTREGQLERDGFSRSRRFHQMSPITPARRCWFTQTECRAYPVGTLATSKAVPLATIQPLSRTSQRIASSLVI